MTEEEAKTKWCPQVFDPNVSHEYRRDLCCITSECMWWVWDRTPGHCDSFAEESGDNPTWNVPQGHCGAIK